MTQTDYFNPVWIGWHCTEGFDLSSLREFAEDCRHYLGSGKLNTGWQVIEVAVSITEEAAC